MSSIFKIESNSEALEQINKMSRGFLGEKLGIRFTEIGDRSISATMPVDQSNQQPAKVLHGGASCALAEEVASVASNLCLDREKFVSVGVAVTSSHTNSARTGEVKAVATPVKLGRTLHVWNVDLFSDEKKLISSSRVTTAVINTLG